MADIQQGFAKFYPEKLTITKNGIYYINVSFQNIINEIWIETSKLPQLGGIIETTVEDKESTSATIKILVRDCNFKTDFNEEVELYLYYTTREIGNEGIQYENTTTIKMVGVEEDVEPLPDLPSNPDFPDIPIVPDEPETGGTETGGVLEVNTKKIVFEYNSTKVESFDVESNNIVEVWSYEANDLFNITIDDFDEKTCKYSISLKVKNEVAEWVYTTAKLIANYANNTTSEITVEVVIKGNQIIPIWKDDYYRVNNAGAVKYRIIDVQSEEVIYSGNAKGYPNTDYLEIHINKAVRGYVNSVFKDFGTKYTYLYDYAIKFDLELDGVRTATFTIINDWSYDNAPSTYYLSYPIRKELDSRQYFMCSLYYRGNGYIPTTYKVNFRNSSRDYSFKNTNQYQSLIADKLTNYNSISSVQVGAIQYSVQKTCYDYCLYYVNAYGGWDSLLVKGNVMKSDKITPSYYSKQFKTNTLDFEKVKYNNNITTTYELHTDWFNDEEQSKLFHLIESTMVFIHNLETDVLEPVVITNSSFDYKTFKNNGKKKFNNKITVEVSQTKVRQ